MNAGLKEALLQLTAALEQKLLASPAALPAPSPKPYHNLPRPDYASFVGRETELAWLRQRLHPADRAWQIAITGIGGVGKSALALAIAHEFREKYAQLPPEARFDAIIWISAKEEVLTAQGREKAGLPETVLHTLEDVYTAIARALEREDITRALPEDQSRVVEKALKEQRTLLLMDNLESVQDERIKPFLRNLPAPTKALITSREWLDVADVWQLKGLSAEEADLLIVEESALRQVSLDEAQRQRIYDLTSGLPLPIKLAVARLSGGESFPAVERWLGDSIGDLPEYCIIGQAELARRRSLEAWKLLLACSLFDRTAGASREALGHIVDLSLADRDSGLTQLQRLFLINRTESDRFWVLPIVQRYASAQFDEVSENRQIVERWLSWLVRFSSGYGFSSTYGIQHEISGEQFIRFSQEYPNILLAIRWCRDQGRWVELLGLAENAWGYPYYLAIFTEFVEILDYASEAAQVLEDERVSGRILLQRGRLAEILSEPPEIVIGFLDEAEKIAIDYGNEADLTENWATRSSLFRRRNQFEAAKQIATRLFERGIQTNNPKQQELGAYRLYQIYVQQGNLDEASKWLKEAEKASSSRESWGRGVGLIYGKGNLLAKQGDYIGAESYILKALEHDTQYNGRRYIAYDKRMLARIYLLTERYNLALQTAEEASTLFERLGMLEEQDEVLELISAIEAKIA
jgi:LuxR family glucitol operon transcriptional activator